MNENGEQRICPRCGAPIDATKSKCPYCLTSYFDISCIDINDHEPFYLKLKRGGITFTALVCLDNISIGQSVSTRYAYSGRGYKLSSAVVSRDVDLSMELHSVPDVGRGVLFTLENEKD